ncbi:hypothetical protein LCGC14_1494770, partial [marine sediment metagenome]
GFGVVSKRAYEAGNDREGIYAE